MAHIIRPSGSIHSTSVLFHTIMLQMEATPDKNDGCIGLDYGSIYTCRNFFQLIFAEAK